MQQACDQFLELLATNTQRLFVDSVNDLSLVVEESPDIVSVESDAGLVSDDFELLEELNLQREEWKDTAELRDLFESESLAATYGSFFDQRFVDYLARQFGDIDRIHWRKFEGLTCEFFERAGFRVKIGPVAMMQHRRQGVAEGTRPISSTSHSGTVYAAEDSGRQGGSQGTVRRRAS